MSEFAIQDFLRWFMTGLLAIVGSVTLLAPRQLAAVCPHVPTRGLDAATAGRIEDAAYRRKRLENISPAYGIAVGAAWLIFAGCCAAGWATPAMWYAAAFLSLAAGMAAAYLHLRAIAGRRVAVLDVRSASGVVPWYWFAAAGGVALAALAWSELRAPGWAAALICLAALASTFLAWRVAEMPALLGGDDVAAERFVDEHLRFGRATSILLFAFVEIFVFVMFDIGLARENPEQPIAALVAFAWIAYSAWTIANKLRPQHAVL